MDAASLFAMSPVLLPLAAALCVMVIGAFRPSHALMSSAAIGGLVAALLSLGADGEPRLVFGMMAIDASARFFWAVILASSLAVALLARGYWSRRRVYGEDHHREFYLLLMLAVVGALTLTASAHFALAFLALELMSLSLFGLLAYAATQRRALESGIKYLVLSGASSALLLFGMALLYAASGSLLVDAVRTAPPSPYVTAGVALMLVGLGFKLSLVPFHMWTPDVYEGASAPATAFVSTVAKIAVAAWLLRFLQGSDAWALAPVAYALLLLTSASMLAGNVLALLQDNIKRMLAYSSISHLGYMVMPLAVAGGFAAETVAFYAMAYALTLLAAFGAVSVLSEQTPDGERVHIASYRGLFWRRPWIALVLAFSLVSLAGLPLTAGFVAKFYVIAAGLEGGLWLALAALVIGSAIGIYFYLRFLVTLFLAAGHDRERESPSMSGAVLIVLLFFVIVLGVFPQPFSEAAARIAGN